MPFFAAMTRVNLRTAFRIALPAVAFAGLATGSGLAVAGLPGPARIAWTMAVAPVLATLVVEIIRGLWQGEIGLDIVAALSMSAALMFGEALAAAVVALMYAGGMFLESFAERRARREMHALLARVPRTATRHREGGLNEVPLDAIRPGDLLLIRQGDVVPVDGTIASAQAVLDQSALTGEALPIRLPRGEEVMSGAANAGDAFDLRAGRRAAESTYAGIVRLVEAAQRSKAPMARLADRYSLLFLAATVAIAGLAWSFTGDPVRAVAVLVVATPCPLILAVPIALAAGLSRAAHFGVLIKGAQPLEALTRVRTLILDKTGTLTDGRPRIVAIEPIGGWPPAELLRLAAAADQASPHPMARAIVATAHARGLALPAPTEISEAPGDGLTARVEGHLVSVGGPGFVRRRIGAPAAATPARPGAAVVAVAIDGQLAGYLVLADSLRPETAGFIAGVRRFGIHRILLATGDRADVAQAVTRGLGLDGVHAGLAPEEKLRLVQYEGRRGPVMMVGDGVNDAPALASAAIGVAMGARGSAASAEAADVVLLVDDLARLLAGLHVAAGARRIALQSVIAGIGLSVAGMLAAASGHLTPVQGALLQEAIDIAVIVNALRALRIAPQERAGA